MSIVNDVPNVQHIPVVFEMKGDGPGVLFIHGWNHSGRIWNPVISQLGNDITACTIDLPGFGSSPPLPNEQVTIRYYSWITTQIIAQTQEALESKNRTLRTIVADSLGAIFILEALRQIGDAASMPETDALSLVERGTMKPLRGVSGNYGKENVFEGVSRVVLSGCPSDGLPGYISAAKNLSVIEGGLSAVGALPVWLSKRLLRILSLGTVHRFEDISDDLVESVLQADPMTSQRIFKDMAEYSFMCRDQKMREIVLNMVVLRGEWDRVTSESNARRLADEIGGSYREIPNVGHTPMIENPHKYAHFVK
jgi:pimeloyl-ACP methyl ester carboxylesterase